MSTCFTAKMYQAAGLLCLAGIAIPATAFADDATPEATGSTDSRHTDTQGLAEIVVTANKVEEASSKVGLTIQTIGDKALVEQHITTLQDLAEAVPGLTFTETESSTPVYTLRGVGFYETSLAAYPAVSVYIDQMPLAFPFLTSHTDLDLERVEVLKGPQGILFGQNSTGGAINFIAAKPTDHFSQGFDLTYGRFNRAQLDGFISGPLGGSVTARFALSEEHGGDWQQSYTRNDTLGAMQTFNSRLILDWRPVDQLRF